MFDLYKFQPKRYVGEFIEIPEIEERIKKGDERFGFKGGYLYDLERLMDRRTPEQERDLRYVWAKVNYLKSNKPNNSFMIDLL